MDDSATESLDMLVMDAYIEFEKKLFAKGRFPYVEFKAFFDAVWVYLEYNSENPLIHRNVAGAVNGLRTILELASSRAPDHAIRDADRLECMLFAGYDPHFVGDEPPGL